jgi:hypothetical protein
MRRPVIRRLSASEQVTFNKWLVGVCIFYGVIAVFMAGGVIVNQYLAADTSSRTTAATHCTIKTAGENGHRVSSGVCP